MKKTATFILFAFALTFANAQNVLIIYDESPTEINTASLANYLTSEGLTVTFSDVIEYQWDNTNPSLTGYDAVIHLNGETYGYEMPLAGQLALMDFVENNSGKYIGAEWNGYQVDDLSQMTAMIDLCLLERGNNANGNLDMVVVPAQATHQVMANIVDFQLMSADVNGTARVFATEPSVVLMTEGSRDAVVVREFGNGKVLGFHHSGNYANLSHYSNTYIQEIVLNFINWDYGLSVNSLELTDAVSLYPNPSSKGIVKIDAKSVEIESVKVYNVSGQIVDVDVDLNSNTINTASLENGSYIVKVLTNKGIAISELVVM